MAAALRDKVKAEFQSTLPRGSDANEVGAVLVYAISIHAPSRERLNGRRRCFCFGRISIHAPSRERRLRR